MEEKSTKISPKIPSKEISIKVNGETFKLTYPTIGQLIDIETKKISISRSTYGDLERLGGRTGQVAKYNIDMIATLSVLAPDINNKIHLLDLKLEDSREVFIVYMKQVLTWLVEWQNFLDSPIDDE